MESFRECGTARSRRRPMCWTIVAACIPCLLLYVNSNCYLCGGWRSSAAQLSAATQSGLRARSQRAASDLRSFAAGSSGGWARTPVEDSEAERIISNLFGGPEGGPLKGQAQEVIPRFTACNGAQSQDECLTFEQFQEQFVKLRRPVLIRGLGELTGWPADSFWDKEQFLSTLGADMQVRLSVGTGFPLLGGGSDMQPVKSLSDIVHSYLHDPRLFVFDYDKGRTKQLASSMKVPDWLADRADEADPVISLGGKAAGLPWHMHGETWFVPLAGRKRWFLYPPGHATREARGSPFYSTLGWLHNTLPELAAEKRPFTFLQEPGELLYLPASWSHATLNLDEVLGYGQQKPYHLDEPDRDHDVWVESVMEQKSADMDPEACVVLGAWLSRRPDLLQDSKFNVKVGNPLGDPENLFRMATGKDGSYVSAFLAASRHQQSIGRDGFAPLRAAAVALAREECTLLEDARCDKLNLALVWLSLARLMKRSAQSAEEHDLTDIVASKILPLLRDDAIGMEVLGLRIVET
eukprot:TRINITY_DN32002_c0_g1_i1.p1 TRINITY_DN32002_c0_g1~~TRINITY_DN32002_c0_g1_i1.p1  ORF type:complete len:522 (-),score=47.84 TRINITY_DN32002_c0_g1_i1:519-2084(-)